MRRRRWLQTLSAQPSKHVRWSCSLYVAYPVRVTLVYLLRSNDALNCCHANNPDVKITYKLEYKIKTVGVREKKVVFDNINHPICTGILSGENSVFSRKALPICSITDLPSSFPCPAMHAAQLGMCTSSHRSHAIMRVSVLRGPQLRARACHFIERSAG